jgi:hypothetical protein
MSLQQHCGWIFHRLLTFSGQQYKKMRHNHLNHASF